MKQLNYGIISAASIVPRFVSGLNETKHSRALAIGASTLSRAEKMAKELNIPKYYGSYVEVYQDCDIDIIYIANINDQHFPEIMKALSFGKHVVCEKPMVLKPKEVKEAFSLAKEKNVFLMEAQKSVFLPTTKFVKDRIRDKKFGQLKQINLTPSYASRFPDDHWMNEPHQGGVLFGSGSYVIEYLLYLLDNPDFDYVAQTLLGSKKEIDDVTISFDCESKLLVTSHLTMRVHTKNEANFYFDEAIITIKNFWKSNELVIYTNENNKTEKQLYDKVPEMVYEIEHIYDCISKGLIQSPIMSEEITKKCVKLVDEIYQSTRI